MLILRLNHAYTRGHRPPSVRAGCAIRRANLHQSKFAVTGLTDAQIASFLTTLQHAVATHNIARIVSLTVFPLTVNGKPSIKNAAALKSQYNVIFNARVVKEIKKQVFNELFANSDGIMIGNGEVWFAGIYDSDKCNHVRVRIVAISNI